MIELNLTAETTMLIAKRNAIYLYVVEVLYEGVWEICNRQPTYAQYPDDAKDYTGDFSFWGDRLIRQCPYNTLVRVRIVDFDHQISNLLKDKKKAIDILERL